MKCHDSKHMMHEYLNGTLSRSARQELERHLLECPSCFQSIQNIKSGQSGGASSAASLLYSFVKPSSGIYSLFLISSFCIIIFFMALVAVYFKIPLLFKF